MMSLNNGMTPLIPEHMLESLGNHFAVEGLKSNLLRAFLSFEETPLRAAATYTNPGSKYIDSGCATVFGRDTT